MSAEHILDAVGLLDDELIQEAETYTVRKQRTNYRRWMAWAASFAVVLVLGYGLTHLGMGGGGNGGAATSSNGASGAASMPTAPIRPSAASGGGTAGEGLNGSDKIPGIAMGPGTAEDPCLDPSQPLDSTSPSGGDWWAAIMVDGVLYWSTETPILGEVDESVIRTVTSYTDGQPEEDGQTNFDRDLTTRYAMTRDGLVVQIEGEWILFDPVPPWEN